MRPTVASFSHGNQSGTTKPTTPVVFPESRGKSLAIVYASVLLSLTTHAKRVNKNIALLFFCLSRVARAMQEATIVQSTGEKTTPEATTSVAAAVPSPTQNADTEIDHKLGTPKSKTIGVTTTGGPENMVVKKVTIMTSEQFATYEQAASEERHTIAVKTVFITIVLDVVEVEMLSIPSKCNDAGTSGCTNKASETHAGRCLGCCCSPRRCRCFGSYTERTTASKAKERQN